MTIITLCAVFTKRYVFGRVCLQYTCIQRVTVDQEINVQHQNILLFVQATKIKNTKNYSQQIWINQKFSAL